MSVKAFDNFDTVKISKYTENKIEKLLQNPDIVRNKLKVKATVENAKIFLELQKEHGSFDQFIWSFVDGKPIKKKGFKFVGSTTCYAYIQAVGMVNDHLVTCFRYSEVKNL